MKIKKSGGCKGYETATRKGYLLRTECGEEFDCKPTSAKNGFMMNGKPFKTIKQAKLFIETEDPFTIQRTTVCETPPDTASGTWASIDPCAWLVVAEPECDCPHKLNTLDCHGYLDENGKPDIHRANREIARGKNYFE